MKDKYKLKPGKLALPKFENPRNPKKQLIPLSPARKNITFATPKFKKQPQQTPIVELTLNQAVLDLCSLYIELGLAPMQAYRSALADFPEAIITGGAKQNPDGF